ncbi:ribosome-binding factor A [Candidatus Mycoplasma haematominutum]|uniref:Ribosome-binding factor A n=1 Tax=Candidatus Mycoplasma haematominutum 'Birmingham 1' TaxID=1116213 RepID=G8C2W4_9MOLU|nr:ribosome-binding factor A [Candidatus Mycoplasma haematominutum]CCE66662.1 ribosome-binding factor A [Candidatus Mycoplasma haematominutum 'Birmingham 1']
MYLKHEKLSKDIYAVLRRIWLSELNEQFYAFIGINFIKINKSVSQVVIYLDLDSLAPKWSKEETLLKLRKLSPFFKRQLVEKLKLPTYCKLIFQEDNFIKQARKVENLITAELKK